MTALRSRRRPRRRQPRASFFAELAATLERLADDSAALCGCDDGDRCVA